MAMSIRTVGCRSGRRMTSNGKTNKLTPDQQRDGARLPRYAAIEDSNHQKVGRKQPKNAESRHANRIAQDKVRDRIAEPYSWKPIEMPDVIDTSDYEDLDVIDTSDEETEVTITTTNLQPERCGYFSESKRQACMLMAGHKCKHFHHEDEKGIGPFSVKEQIKREG